MADDVATLFEELQAFRTQKEKAEAETQAMRTKLHSAVRKGKAIEAEKSALSSQLQDLAKKFEAVAGSKVSTLDAKGPVEQGTDTFQVEGTVIDSGNMQALQRQVARQSEELAELHSTHKRTLAELDVLRHQQQDAATKAVAALQEEHQLHLQSINARHKDELAEQRLRHEVEHSQILKAVAQGEAEAAAAKQFAEHLQQQLLRLQQGYAEVETQQAEQAQADHSRVESLENQIDALESQVESLENQVADAFSAAEASDKESINLKAKLDAVWQRCEELEQEVEKRIPIEPQKASEEVQFQHPEALDMNPAGSQQAADLELELQASKDREEDLKQQIASLQAATVAGPLAPEQDSDLQKQLEEANNELEMARQNAGVMREALQAAAAKIQAAQDGKSQAQNLVEELKKEVGNLQARIVELEDRSKAAQVGEAAACNVAETKDAEAAGLRKRLAELEGSLSVQLELEAEMSATLEKLSQSRDEAEDLRSQLRKSSTELSAANRSVKELEQQLHEALSAEAATLEEAEMLRRQAAAEALQLKEAATKQLATASEAREAAQAECKAARELQAEARRAEAAATAQSAEARESMEKLQAEEAARKQRFGFLHSAFAKEKAALQQRVDELERATTGLHQTVNQLRQDLNSADQVASSAQEEAHSFRIACKSAESRIAELERLLENPDADAAIAAAENTAADALSQAQEAEKRCTEAMTTSAALREELAEARQRIAETVSSSEKIRSRLSAAEVELEKLKQTKEGREALLNGHANGLPNGADANIGRGSNEELEALREDLDALQSEKAALNEKLRAAEKKVAAASAVQHAKVASLEKQNQELQWQVAMLARDPEAPTQRHRAIPVQPSGIQEAAGGEFLPRAVGLILRYRRGLLIGYFAVLHVLLYILLVNRGHASSTCLTATEAALSADSKANLRGFY